MKKEPAIDRFWKYVMPLPWSGCWIWMGFVTPKGYGKFARTSKDCGSAHKFSYEHFKGPIPAGLEIDHLCRVRCCVNPDHLEAVTHTVNIRRGDYRESYLPNTHCKRGHPFDEKNTWRDKNRNNAQHCRKCHAEREARKRAARLV